MALNQAITTQLITSIKSTLSNVGSVKKVYAHPFAGNPEKYPAVIFYPIGFDNDFSDVSDNMKNYRFKIYGIVSAEIYSDEDIFETILPNMVDEILEKFDEDWNYGTINGHRVWSLINTGLWGKSEEENGVEAWVEMDLIIKMQTTN